VLQQKVLIIDDDPFTIELITETLQREHYEVLFASSGRDGLLALADLKPHLVLLDIIMPDIDGWETCARIRQASAVPIIMLTARSSREDIVRGLKAGADDYLVKPFHQEVLSARVSALLRRVSMPNQDDQPIPLRFGNGELVIDLQERQLYVSGNMVNLTPKEFDLLVFMASRPGRVVRTEFIFESVWSYDSEANLENVKWYVWRLRQKIERSATQPKYIVTERGIGYRFLPHY
jgi:two-component system KDP operon response regulator KdpE